MKKLVQNGEIFISNPVRKKRNVISKISPADITAGTMRAPVTKKYYGRRSLYFFERLQSSFKEESIYIQKHAQMMKDAIAVKMFWEQMPLIKIELGNQFQLNQKWRQYICQLPIPFENCLIGRLQQILDAKSLILLHRVHEMLTKREVPVGVIYFCLFELFDDTKALSRYDDIMKNEQSLVDFANRSTYENLEIFKSHKN